MLAASWQSRSCGADEVSSDLESAWTAAALCIEAASPPYSWHAEKARIAWIMARDESDEPKKAMPMSTCRKPFESSSMVVIIRDAVVS